MGAACFRVLVPPVPLLRRPPRRRSAVRVRGRAAAGRRVEVSDSRARWPPARRRSGRLAAGRALVCVRVAGFPPPFCAPSARPRPAYGRLRWRFSPRLAGDGVGRCRSVSRRVVPLPPPRPRGAPPFPSSGLPLRGSPPSGNLSGGRGTTSRVLWPLAKVGCARGARPAVAAVSAVSLPPLACALSLAAPCAPSAPFGARRPRRLAVRFGGEGVSVLQRAAHGGRARAFQALRSPPMGGDEARSRAKKPLHGQNRTGAELELTGWALPSCKTGETKRKSP